MRTLEEIGEVFGDRVAGHYFGATESELDLMKRQALRVKDDGELPLDVVESRQDVKGQDSGSDEHEKGVIMQHETA